MIKKTETSGWRQARRRSARDAIVEAAWALVRDEGLAGLSLRDLARRAGISPPTVYAYFDSKNAIYDAMFGAAAAQFAGPIFPTESLSWRFCVPSEFTIHRA